MEKKNVVRLSENEINRMVEKAVKKVINEWNEREPELNEYEAGISYFIDSSSPHAVKIKDKALYALDKIRGVEIDEVYDDGEDWCIDCTFTVNAYKLKEAFSEVEKLANKVNLTWDYHYLKGLNTDEYWQP